MTVVVGAPRNGARLVLVDPSRWHPSTAQEPPRESSIGGHLIVEASWIVQTTVAVKVLKDSTQVSMTARLKETWELLAV